jgi:hypothetical protein
MHQPARLFNAVDLQKPSDTIAICEGELDAVIASQLLPSVGVPGVKAWRPHFNRLFGGYRRVLILADNDDKKDGTQSGNGVGRESITRGRTRRVDTTPTRK